MNYEAVQTELYERLAERAVSTMEALNALLEHSADDPEIHAKLVGSLLCTSVEPERAHTVLSEIIEHHRDLSSRLGRDLDLRVAAMDYATRHPELVREPVVVDQHMLALSQRLAAVDELTGLFNRRFLDVYLAKEVNRAQRHGETFSIIFLDLDNFKNVNDSYGHDMGDQVLARFSREILDLLRKEDFAARYGGEEFVVVLPHSNASGARRFATRLTRRLRRIDFPHGTQITYSGGIAAFPEHGISEHELLRNADAALYQAKLNGKGHVRRAASDKRAAPRHVADLSARCYVEGKELGEVRLRDISRQGVSVMADTLLSPGQTIRFRIDPPNDAAPTERVEVFAKVVWSRKVADAEYRFGGRWASEDEERVRSLVERVARE